MKPLRRPKKIGYIVYPPNYSPTATPWIPYIEVDTFKKAKKLAKSLGYGTDINRRISKPRKWKSSDGTIGKSTSFYTMREYGYDKYGFYVKYDPNGNRKCYG
jgi:hypothetical protein